DFIAQLGFETDIYDGKLLIDSIDRTLLPQRNFPFVIGDELVSLDGKDAEQLLNEYKRYGVYRAHPDSNRRFAALYITYRIQAYNPHAAEVGPSGTVVIRRQNGNLETYSVPWSRSGRPVEVGPAPLPQMVKATKRLAGDSVTELDSLRHAAVDDSGLQG